MTWEVFNCSRDVLDIYLSEGWEPYAVDAMGLHWLRRWVGPDDTDMTNEEFDAAMASSIPVQVVVPSNNVGNQDGTIDALRTELAAVRRERDSSREDAGLLGGRYIELVVHRDAKWAALVKRLEEERQRRRGTSLVATAREHGICVALSIVREMMEERT